jgi:peptidoglycan/LPS O-acetylase OafA/YrhL
MTTLDRRPPRRPKLPVLTSLRFFAAAEVMIFHFGRMTDVDLVTYYFGTDLTRFPGNFLQIVTSAGHEAVMFFFVLSGFILTYVYADASEDGGFAVRKSDFWWARFARLAPTFYLGLLLAAPFLAYSVFVVHSQTVSLLAPSLVLTPIFLQAWWPPAMYLWNFPSWSLSVEFFFYALFPLLASAGVLMTRRQLLFLALVFVVAMAPVRAALLTMYQTAPEPAHTFAIYFPPFSLPQFILGIAVARMFLYGPTLSPRTHKAILALALAGLVVAFGWHSDLPPSLAWLRPEAGTAGILFAAVIFGAAGAAGSFKLLASPVMVFLGDASYSMYILHIPIGLWWKWIATKVLGLSLPPLLNSSAMFLLVIAVAALNQAYLEPPLRRWLLRRRSARQSMIAASAQASSSTGSIE